MLPREKRCHVCKKVKIATEFRMIKMRGKDALASRCVDCNKEYMKRYYKSNTGKLSEYRRENQEKINARKRERYREDPEYRRAILDQVRETRIKHPERKRNTALRSNYGLSLSEFNLLLASQDGGCAICGNKESGGKHNKNLHVDHDHDSGVVRGILCASCNFAIGLLKDDPELLMRAAMYLQEFRERTNRDASQ